MSISKIMTCSLCIIALCSSAVIANAKKQYDKKNELAKYILPTDNTSHKKADAIRKEITYKNLQAAKAQLAQQQNTQTDTVWTCAFCNQPIVKNNQPCQGEENPWSICTHENLNWGTPLHKGVHVDGREKARYNIPFEPGKLTVIRQQENDTQEIVMIKSEKSNTIKKHEPTCPDCGRTREQIKKHGHNHKGPYTLQ